MKIIIWDLTNSILLWKGRYKNAFVPLSKPIMQPFKITIATNNNFLWSLKFRQVGLQKQNCGKSTSVGCQKSAQLLAVLYKFTMQFEQYIIKLLRWKIAFSYCFDLLLNSNAHFSQFELTATFKVITLVPSYCPDATQFVLLAR